MAGLFTIRSDLNGCSRIPGLTEALPQHTNVFIRRDGSWAIAAPVHYSETGILYEDSAPSMLEGLDPGKLGAEVKRTMALSTRKPKDLASHKQTDWPSFKVSGERSVKSFESAYIYLKLSGANHANLVYLIEGFPDKSAELRVAASISSAFPAEIGALMIRVFEACRDRRV